ncbi:MAG: asparagine synthase (glutamine-hydrolyzing) [Thermoplasmata archaeon]|nr:asparagine synthase (glutamine-hydrolyzing) [Thermoplasmata archaeon]
MCGICGFWNHPNSERVKRMMAAMRHRGPDDSGLFWDEKVSMGMARLAVIDLNPTGHQPMCNPEETVWIVYNGEVYNFKSEREHLEALGYRFMSTSDTEVILRLYEYYGDEFLLRLRGMFALAIYDKRRGPGKERMLLARDQLGIKPLLYAQVGSRFVFASEIKALLASGLIAPELDPEALRLLLTYGSVYQPRTIVSNVKMLLPAHRMILENGETRIERYWSLAVNRYSDLRNSSYWEQVEVLNDALVESVRLQMVSDVPLGAFLSGGVDSSVLVAMMTREAGHRIRTFSVGFEAEGAAIDESQDALRTARYLGTDHNRVLVRGQDVSDRIHHIAASLDQPSVDGVNSYFVSMAARQGVTVAISGTGGDELFAGYPWFMSMALQQGSAWMPFSNNVWEMAEGFAGLPIFDPLIPTRSGKWLHALRSRSGFLNRYAAQYQIFGPGGAARLLAHELRQKTQSGRMESRDLAPIDEVEMGSVIERVTGLCLRGYTNNQLLRDIDATSMAHSLEVRVPYLDTVITDMALSLPDDAKLKQLDQLPSSTQSSYRATGAKRILIDIGKPLLPKDFDVQPKRGFAMPFDFWLRGPLRAVFLDSLSEGGIGQRGWFDYNQVAAVRDGFISGQSSWSEPWLLMMIELWCQQVLDKASPVEP